MFLTKAELKTHISDYSLQAIIDSDETIVAAAIDGAIEEAKGYLTDYNRDSIFTATAEARNQLLLIFVKDIAVWHLINLSNPGVEFKVKQDRYERAVEWLKQVQKGVVTPNLPKIEVSAGIRFTSNPKRENHY